MPQAETPAEDLVAKNWTEEQVNLFLQNPEEYMIAKPQKGNLVEFIEYTEVSKK